MKKFSDGIVLGYLIGFFLGHFLHIIIMNNFKKEAVCRGFAIKAYVDKQYYWLSSPEGHYNHCEAEEKVKKNRM